MSACKKCIWIGYTDCVGPCYDYCACWHCWNGWTGLKFYRRLLNRLRYLFGGWKHKPASDESKRLPESPYIPLEWMQDAAKEIGDKCRCKLGYDPICKIIQKHCHAYQQEIDARYRQQATNDEL